MEINSMLSKIREIKENNQKYTASPLIINENDLNYEKDNFLSEAKILMSEAIDKKKVIIEDNSEAKDKLDKFVIKKTTPQFGDVRSSQEDAIRKTIGEHVKLGDDALVYYPDIDDITMSGKIDSLNLSFQFRLNSASGDGCFIWCDGTCVSESNYRILGKIRDAFMNWKSELTENGDLMEKLKKESKKNQ